MSRDRCWLWILWISIQVYCISSYNWDVDMIDTYYVPTWWGYWNRSVCLSVRLSASYLKQFNHIHSYLTWAWPRTWEWCPYFQQQKTKKLPIFSNFVFENIHFFHTCLYVPCHISEIIRPNLIKCYVMIGEHLGMMPVFSKLWRIKIWLIISHFCVWKSTFFHNCKDSRTCFERPLLWKATCHLRPNFQAPTVFFYN